MNSKHYKKGIEDGNSSEWYENYCPPKSVWDIIEYNSGFESAGKTRKVAKAQTQRNLDRKSALA